MQTTDKTNESTTAPDLVTALVIMIRVRLKTGHSKQKVYLLERLDPQDGRTRLAWRLRTRNGPSGYVVSVDEWGVSCTCAAWEFNRGNGQPKTCKHIRGLLQKGLLPGWKEARRGH